MRHDFNCIVLTEIICGQILISLNGTIIEGNAQAVIFQGNSQAFIPTGQYIAFYQLPVSSPIGSPTFGKFGGQQRKLILDIFLGIPVHSHLFGVVTDAINVKLVILSIDKQRGGQCFFISVLLLHDAGKIIVQRH